MGVTGWKECQNFHIQGIVSLTSWKTDLLFIKQSKLEFLSSKYEFSSMA